MSDPKVLNAPDRIWLVYGEAGYDIEHSEVDPEDVCWSHQSEFDLDVGYVRADIHEALEARVADLTRGWDEASADRHRLLLEVKALDARVTALTAALTALISNFSSGTESGAAAYGAARAALAAEAKP